MTQYLIGKVSDMVKMSQEGLVVIALLASVRTSRKETIYYIQQTALIPGQSPLYDMIRGYFDLRRIALKAMPHLWPSGSEQI